MVFSTLSGFLKGLCSEGKPRAQKTLPLLKPLGVLFFSLLLAVSPVFSQTPVFINEIHYDNTGTDADEAIEIAGPAGTDLTGWSIVLYNGANGASYDTDALSGTIPNLGSGFGVVVLNYPSNGIQNGAPDGIALVNASNVVIQFLSYEGSFTAVGGPADGMTSIDIGVDQEPAPAVGSSLQLTGTGANYEDFTWTETTANTFGAFNTGQTFVGGEVAPAVSSTTPANGATGVAIDAGITINFSEAVDVTGSWFSINGSTSSSHTATVSGGPQSFTLDPDPDFANNETVTVTVFAANVTDQDTDDPPDNMDADYTFSFTTVGVAGGIVINEIDSDTPGTDALEFVELYDGGTGNTPLDGMVVVFYNGATDQSYAAFDLDGFTTNSAGFFLMGNSGVTPAPSLTFTNGLLQNGADAVALYTGNATDFPTNTPVTTTNLIDAIVYGTSDADDAGLLVLLNSGQPQVDENSNGASDTESNARIPNGGIARNTDTYQQQMPTPGASNVSQEIWEIQGSGLASPFATQTVTTNNNVVTALATDGFFMQTPDQRSDGDAQTSDGIFVFTNSSPTVSVGDLVNVTGLVQEFFNFTEFSGSPTVTVNSSGNPLPAPVQFDGATPSPNQPQSATELERFEGMQVEIASGVVAGPNQFFASDPTAEVFIVAGSNRPFREPGILFPGLSGLPIWDGNPEVFELDPDRLGLPNEAIPAGSSFSATGILGFEFSGYELWPTQYSVNEVTLPRAVRSRNAGEATIATLNLHRFFDTVNDPNIDDPVPTAQEYADKLNKFSMYVRDVLRAPNILAVQEAENLTVLQDLANKIAADDVTLIYTPYLEEGNDVGGIDVGFLVRNGVTVNSVTQLGKTEIFTFDGSLLHDRPPLVLDATLSNGQAVTVMNLHQRSLTGIDDPADGPRVRQKRHEQAVSVSLMVQNFQNGNPNVNLVVTGDFNAFQFTDGYVHVLGQIMGTPANSSQALIPGTDNVNPDLINKVLSLPAAERYSFNFGGSAQVLDHMLVSQALDPAVTDVEYARGNSDAAVKFETDGTTPLRSSDHDGLVLYVVGAPAANAGDDKTICAGGSTTIGGTPAASGGSGGPYSFSWSPAAGLSATNVANPTASPVATTTYTLTVTDQATGLTDTDEVTVTVETAPTVTFDPVGPFCVNDEAVDLSSFVSPAGGTFSGNGISGNMFDPADAGVGTHTITYTLTGTCSGSASRDVTVHPLPTVTFDPVGPFLVTDAPIDLSSAVSPAGGTFAGPGISGSTFDPGAAGVGTHQVTYTYTDANSCSKTASQSIVVNSESAEPSFVFLADDFVTLDRHGASQGDIHANRLILFKRGKPSTFTGNLTSAGDIIIRTKNTINGNVTADDRVKIDNGVTINGTVAEHADVDEIPLPTPSFSAGGRNYTVRANRSLSLSPGRYGNVVVGNGATLHLRHNGTTGEYFFKTLVTSSEAVLSIDVAEGPVAINVVYELEFDDEVEVEISSGEAGSREVTFTTLQCSRLTLGNGAGVLGSIIAVKAEVRLSKNSRFKGSIVAKAIVVEQNAIFLPHGSATVLTTTQKSVAPEDGDSEEREITALVTDYELAQNYPNPFNPSTTIRFALPEASEVKLEIYNLLGQKVRILVDAHLEAGYHNRQWDATNDFGQKVSSGVYVYRIHAGSFVQTKRMILMK
jgi:predicted extracellular nuclease/cytoskeletal protein CcmA (bactofilin family)